MNLDFASPLYLLGLLGISLPVLVHLLTRRQQTHIKFSAVYLLFQSQKRSIKRSKPNRLLLLLIRCLAIAGLSFALANPIFSFGETDEFLSSTPSANVFILDDSYSMATRAKDETLYARALQALTDTFKRTSPDSSFSLVLASSPARTLQDWAPDPNVLLKRLTISKPSYRTTDIGGAVSETLELLKSAPQRTKRIFILTDGDKNGWVPENFPEAGEYGQSLSAKVMDFSGYQTDENRAAIKNVDVTQSFLTNSRVLRVKASVANLLPERPVRDLRLTLWVNGKKQSEASLNLPENSAVDKEFSFPYLGDEPATGFVEIAEDALVVDNRRHFTYQPDKRVKALIVDGDPNTVAHQSETFYLEHALNPFYGTLSDIEPTVVTRSELPSHNLLLYSVVILSNVRDLPFDYERELEKFVLRGGALFISLGDQIEAKFYNEKM
ncbi:MAG: BatA domain-containing protein, partial [Nitrospinales bacterium]